jgi:hypothetical protein
MAVTGFPLHFVILNNLLLAQLIRKFPIYGTRRVVLP